MSNLSYNDGLEPHHKHLVDTATTHYCEWLNSFTHPEYDDHIYTPAQFLNKDTNEYADVKLEVIRESLDIVDHGLFILTMYDGDDGGPATLFVHAERDWHYTRLASYYKSGQRDDPGDYTPIFEDTYTIGFILQEFDTLFSPVMVENSDQSVKLYTEGN